MFCAFTIFETSRLKTQTLATYNVGMSNVTYQQLDQILSKYYQQQKTCYSQQLLHFIQSKGYDDEDIDDELGDHVHPSNPIYNCTLLDFDPNFPIPTNIRRIISSEQDKELFIFEVIKYCYKHGHPPSDYCMYLNLNACALNYRI